MLDICIYDRKIRIQIGLEDRLLYIHMQGRTHKSIIQDKEVFQERQTWTVLLGFWRGDIKQDWRDVRSDSESRSKGVFRQLEHCDVHRQKDRRGKGKIGRYHPERGRIESGLRKSRTQKGSAPPFLDALLSFSSPTI